MQQSKNNDCRVMGDKMRKPRIYWASDYDGVGNGYGYTRHNKMMRKYAEPYFEFSEDAEIALTILSADKYKPVPGKYNILFTMFEAQQLPPSYLNNMRYADELIAPCTFVKDLFKREGVSQKISVCREGIEPDKFPFKERSFDIKKDKFRILWIGAPNPRKGYKTILNMIPYFERFPSIEIYMKTTAPKVDYDKAREKLSDEDFKKYGEEVLERERITKIELGEVKPVNDLYEVLGKHKNVIFDSRNITDDELLELYHSAHAFAFPSVGEGWGLTLCEAMATGLPCVSPRHTGMVDYFDKSVGYELPFSLSDYVDIQSYDYKAQFLIPSTKDLIRQLENIILNYKQALKKGRKASERIHNGFTWDLSAKRLAEIISKTESKMSQRAA